MDYFRKKPPAHVPEHRSAASRPSFRTGVLEAVGAGVRTVGQVTTWLWQRSYSFDARDVSVALAALETQKKVSRNGVQWTRS